MRAPSEGQKGESETVSECEKMLTWVEKLAPSRVACWPVLAASLRVTTTWLSVAPTLLQSSLVTKACLSCRYSKDASAEIRSCLSARPAAITPSRVDSCRLAVWPLWKVQARLEKRLVDVSMVCHSLSYMISSSQPDFQTHAQLGPSPQYSSL